MSLFVTAVRPVDATALGEFRGSWFALMAAAAGAMAVSTVAMAQAPAPTPPAPAAQAAPQKPAKAARTKAKSEEQGEPAPTAPAKKAPAEAARSIDSGIKLLQANKVEQAIQTFTVAIGSGTLPPPQMARALHQRGIAHRRAGKPAQAISDLTSALWLKNGLQDADRQDAVKQRTDAYREAGLPDQSGEDGKPAGAAPARITRTPAAEYGTAPAPAVATAALVPQQPSAPASSGGGLFANLFGGGTKQAAAPTEPAPRNPPAQASTSGWSSTGQKPDVPTPAATTVKAAPPPAPAPPVKTAAVAAPATTPAAASKPVASAAPGIHARIALVRTDAEAQDVIKKLQGHNAALAGKAPVLSAAQFGGMGSFIQVRVGPYASVPEAQALCQKLKGSGLDCVPVDR